MLLLCIGDSGALELGGAGRQRAMMVSLHEVFETWKGEESWAGDCGLTVPVPILKFRRRLPLS